MKKTSGISRRKFMFAAAGISGAAGMGLSLTALSPAQPAHAGPLSDALRKIPSLLYTDWRDVYRKKWTWDKIVKSSHFVNCWYQAHCCWNIYVKDGMVWREEQSATYEATNDEVPDANPRGCQKGGCFSDRMYDAGRIRYPLKRVGPRGSQKWKRISWEQANAELADKMLDVMTKDGTDRVVWELGPLYTEGTMTAGHQRHVVLLDHTVLDMNTEIGDGHRGAAETFGKISFERSADDYFYSDLILIWGSNPLYTQIPNAHFLTEARYTGTKLVCIAPDFSASSVHSDFYFPVKPGCDAALGLAVAHELIKNNQIDETFLVEQTDMPFLVRDDNQLFLRAKDIGDSDRDDFFYVWDQERGLQQAPRKTLALEGIKPTLDGRFEVTLEDNSKVGVRTVFSLLREQLADYTPEKAEALCGTPASNIRELANLLANAKSAAMVTSSNMDKYYHGNLVERTQALVFALTGNYGKKGSGYVGFPWLDHDGIEGFIREMFSLKDMMSPAALKYMGKTIKNTIKWKLDDYTEEMIIYEQGRDIIESGRMTSGAMFWYVHGGLMEVSKDLQKWDPYAKRSAQEYMDLSLKNKWQSVWPRPGNDPKMMFVLGSNPLRRVRSYPQLLKHLWPKLETIVTLDFRMTSTALQSDYVLPAAAWYEHDEHKWVSPLMPHIHSGEKATTYYEARSDWEIISRLTEAVDKRAKERGIREITDRWGDTRSIETLYEKFSNDGAYSHTDDTKVCDALLKHASNLGGLSFDELKKKGHHRFESLGHGMATIGNMTDIKPNETITPLTKHVFDKVPYPTLTRRIQFYIDQELYLELGEKLPIHKNPPTAGGDYPLIMTGGHTRWSIHSNQRDQALLLRQQRGVPAIFMSHEDAQERGIKDGDDVRVFNDLDEFEIQAKVSKAVRKGQTIVYHAWENFQFKNGKGFQNLVPSPLNPVELSGGQYHLRPFVIQLQPGHTDRDTRIDVQRI